MEVTIYGSGYVGLVTAACLAQVGNHVMCVDIDAQKIAQLKQGADVGQVCLGIGSYPRIGYHF